MSADIRLVTLKRKAINNSREINYKNDLRDNEAFSMDYFDIIDVKCFSSSDSLENIMDVGNIGSESYDDVSMQSYPLYCSEETLKKYKDDIGYGNPFSCVEKGNIMPYLSIIQVHITPEILARIKVTGYSAVDLITRFSDDIHLILKDFMSVNKSNIIFRVYQSLAAGDFAVVVRSEFPDTSFHISTLLRKRTIKKQNKSAVQLVLYKTYTMLSICNNDCIKDNAKSFNNNRFVIRCCFANKYWSEKNQIDNTLNGIWNPEKISSLRSLNGRYDFSVELTEQEFCRFLPVIGFYKGFAFGNNEKIKLDLKRKINEKKLFDIVDYLCFLIENGYLSYVNERYLLQNKSISVTDNSYSNIEIEPLMEKDEKFLAQVNEEKYYDLRDKSKTLQKKIRMINCFRKGLNYYFSLLQKLVYLCQTINGLSDTRIYSTILLQQLECVLDGINEYIRVMEMTGDSNILDGMEAYLRKSVCALDSFAQYIRNNNLQSLQTPNYCLQSNASMEKLLIGYGEFLSELIEGYGQSFFVKKIGDISSGFLPVLIPALQDGEMSIEVMFSDIYLYSESKQKKLMVVNCSTLQELTDVPDMIAAFFHEIAHQFRYENRKDRNNVLVHYCTYVAFWPLVKRVSKELLHEVKGLNQCKEIEDLLLKAVDVSFAKIWDKYLKSRESEKYEEKALSVFQLYLEDMMALLWSDDNVWDTWLISRDNFLENLRVQNAAGFFLNLEDITVQQAISILINTEKTYKENTHEELKTYMNKAQNAACFLWKLICIDKNPEERESDWEEMDFNENLVQCIELGQKYEKDIHYLEMIHLAGRRLAKKGNKYSLINDARTEFLENLYNEMITGWKVHIGNPVLRGGGRFLGIDEEEEENKKEFIELICSKMFELHDTVIENINYAIAIYREETSDIYMCTMLELTPFGYLNFMAYNVPTKLGVNVYEEYILRFLTVILSVWETEDSDENMYKHCHSIEKSIQENLKLLLEFYQKEITYEEIYTSFGDILYGKEMGYTDDWDIKMSNHLAQIQEGCEMLRSWVLRNESESSEKEKFLEELLHYQYLCNILIDIIEQFCSFELDYTGYQYVKDDLRNGAHEWEILRVEMKSKNWWSYCSLAGEILNSPYLVYTEKKEEILGKMIDFLQEMYYRNKIKCGHKILCPRKGESH